MHSTHNTRIALATLTLPATLLLLTLGGCRRELEMEILADRTETLEVRMEGEEDLSRSSVSTSTGAMAWTSGDQVFVQTNLDGQTCSVDISRSTISVPLAEGEVRQGYAMYPAGNSYNWTQNESSLSVTYPNSYDIKDALNSENVPIPMVAVNSPGSNTLTFRHVGGLFRITATVPMGTARVLITTPGGYIKGVATVTNPGAANATATISSGYDTVMFDVHDTGLSSSQAITLNLPVPCGTFSGLTLIAFDKNDHQIGSYSDATSRTVTHAKGWKVSCVVAGDRLEITPSSAIIYTTDTRQLSASFWDVSGTLITNVPVTWSRLTGGSATVSSSGLVTATNNMGTTRVQAAVSYGGKNYTASCDVEVRGLNNAVLVDPPVDTQLYPWVVSIEVGVIKTSSFEVYDNANQEITSGYTISWVSSNPSVVAIDHNPYSSTVGRIRGVSAGQATITATISYKGRSIQRDVTVVVTDPVSPTEYYFSVSEDCQVVFSPGNLQYNPSYDEYRFAPHQYVFIGYDNVWIREDVDGWLDLFGWATSGYSYCYPFMIADDWAFGPPLEDGDWTEYNDEWDWGYENAIGDDGPRTWRTLTIEEWQYLFFNRGEKWGWATVNGVCGLILLPDEMFVDPGTNYDGEPFYWAGLAQSYEGNVYDGEGWLAMESAGAIFLPAAGWRNADYLYVNASSDGFYWSSSAFGLEGAYSVDFGDGWFDFNDCNTKRRSFGLSVRLVRDYYE